MARRNSGSGAHADKPFRNFLYAIYSLLNAAAFTAFFYLLYAVERTTTHTAVMIGCGAIVAIGLFMGVIRPLFTRSR